LSQLIRVKLCSRDLELAKIIGKALGSEFETCSTEQFDPQGIEAESTAIDVVLLDVHSAEEATSAAWLERIGAFNRSVSMPPLIVMLGAVDGTTSARLLEAGAYDTLAHPPDIVELRLAIRRAHRFRQAEEALREARAQERSIGRLGELIGASEVMQGIYELAQKVAACDVSVLITGETGTGKELLARAIHRLSSRSPYPFVAFSCANLPETLIEDELFGHERGAFTGAMARRQGRLEAADHGTVFLDEIGDLGLAVQPKLLRVLQERAFERLGSNTLIATDVRTIFATHRDLAKMVEEGKFREDLYYRLNVVQIHLPALRERRDDISFLAKHFLDYFSAQFGKNVARFSQEALRTLEEFEWPGNVRQLQNVVQRAVVLADSRTIEAWHLPGTMRHEPVQVQRTSGLSYEEEVRQFKRRLVLRTLRECGWKKAESARSLKVARGYLHRLINQLAIHEDEEALVQQDVPALPRARIREQVM
jgi:DNA-binding NtrC family response regulator